MDNLLVGVAGPEEVQTLVGIAKMHGEWVAATPQAEEFLARYGSLIREHTGPGALLQVLGLAKTLAIAITLTIVTDELLQGILLQCITLAFTAYVLRTRAYNEKRATISCLVMLLSEYIVFVMPVAFELDVLGPEASQFLMQVSVLSGVAFKILTEMYAGILDLVALIKANRNFQHSGLSNTGTTP